ncbi:hypothetical protein M5U04_20045 [Xenorhabdus sp. XENO-1]|uniref:hypothetical protein n=1 Tax=Xenorhabdus bovienii TaxID=40576 RepID=UPI0020CA4680|nr:hypothetical protein [Xenorhabdus bovienii]MCP9270301.1 hypothetical protein [Xenorhabdus bovienii subsp. africana]
MTCQNPIVEHYFSGQVYFYPVLADWGDCYDFSLWNNDGIDNERRENGLIHLNSESAILHAKALIALTSK